MARKPKGATYNPGQGSLLEGGTATAPLVPAIQGEVRAWRAKGYPGVTPTTKTLLEHWFRPGGHRLAGNRPFAYHEGQREAVETIVWLHEVARVRGNGDLFERFSPSDELKLLRYDSFARRAIKMATGSGKTKVVSLLVAWHTFNAWIETADGVGGGDYASTFLLLAPNIIVYERLVDDFRNGRIFQTDPVVPPEFEVYGFREEFRCYLKGDPEGVGATGALYLTNIDQITDEPSPEATPEEDPMEGVMGAGFRKGAPSAVKDAGARDFPARIAARRGLVAVFNDEAHHVHDEESAWNRAIRRLHDASAGRLLAQYDVTATPRHDSGALFSWVVSDFPLRSAILEGLVKRPVVGKGETLVEAASDVASTRYGRFLSAGVGRWREYREALAPLGKRPVLFVMANDTKEADEIAAWMCERYPEEFAGEGLHVLHTKRNGEMSDADLKEAREVARKVDDPKSGVNAIVSVLMLREGWDVQNVTVIVGLRPYNAAANILPEQTVGRGLRLMFRGVSTTYQERVDVIGTPKFIELIEALEKEEGFEIEREELTKRLKIVQIAPDPEKRERDIPIPSLTPILARRGSLAREIAEIDVMGMASPPLPLPKGMAGPAGGRETFRYEGQDYLTLEKIVDAEYEVPQARTAGEVVSFLAKLVAGDVKLPSLFSAIAPLVRDYLARRAFGREVDLAAPGFIEAISTPVAQHVVKREFAKRLRPLVIVEKEPELKGAARSLLECEGYPHGRETVASAKTVFNLCAPDNGFEAEFARFLDGARDVEAFAKLPRVLGFAIEYVDSAFRLRYYEPDFVARTEDGTRWLLETKGREDVDVRHKDEAAARWCEGASGLTGETWRYLIVKQEEVGGLFAGSTLGELALALGGSL